MHSVGQSQQWVVLPTVPEQPLEICGHGPLVDIQTPRFQPTTYRPTHDKLAFLGLRYPVIIPWYEFLDRRGDLLYPHNECTSALMYG